MALCFVHRLSKDYEISVFTEEILLKVSTFLLFSPLVKAVSEKGRSIKDCDGNGMGDLFKMIVFVPVFLTMCYLVGTFVFHILKLQTNLIRSLVFGFISILALFQVIAYPLYRIGSSLTLLMCLYLPIVFALCVWSVVHIYRSGLLVQAKGKIAQRICALKPYLPLLFLLLVVLLMYGRIVFTYFHYDSDDSYYLPRALEVLSQDRLNIGEEEAWMGGSDEVWDDPADASTMEFFKAMLSRITGVHVTIICKTCFCFAIIVFSLCSIYEYDRTIRDKNQDSDKVAIIVLTLYLILLILGQNVTNSVAKWITRNPWYGKSIVCAVIFPALWIICAEIVRGDGGDIKPGYWVLASITLVAGAQASIIGVIFPVICYFCLGFPFMITYGKKNFVKILKPAIFSLIPISIFAGIVLLEVVINPNRFSASVYVPNWVTVAKSMLGTAHITEFYILGSLYVLIRGRKTARLLIVGSAVTLFLIFLNPVLIGYISKLTTGSVYFRLYWILPLYFAPAYALADAVWSSCSHGKGVSALNIAAVLLMICCVFVDNDISEHTKPYTKDLIASSGRQNLYALPERIIKTADFILADFDKLGRPTVLCYSEPIRQYTAEINIAGGFRSTHMQLRTEKFPGTNMTAAEFYELFGEGKPLPDNVRIKDVLEWLNVDYLYIYDISNNAYDLASEGLVPTTLVFNDGLHLWKNPR